jgi:hypothetical protein
MTLPASRSRPQHVLARGASLELRARLPERNPRDTLVREVLSPSLRARRMCGFLEAPPA